MGVDRQKLYSIDEAAKLLSKSPEEVHEAVYDGELEKKHGITGASILQYAAKSGVGLQYAAKSVGQVMHPFGDTSAAHGPLTMLEVNEYRVVAEGGDGKRYRIAFTMNNSGGVDFSEPEEIEQRHAAEQKS